MYIVATIFYISKGDRIMIIIEEIRDCLAAMEEDMEDCMRTYENCHDTQSVVTFNNINCVLNKILKICLEGYE